MKFTALSQIPPSFPESYGEPSPSATPRRRPLRRRWTQLGVPRSWSAWNGTVV